MSRFLDDVPQTIRRRGLADSTEKTYVSWIKHVYLEHLLGQDHLLAAIMNGAGLGVNEACSSRTKDIDFVHNEIRVTDVKETIIVYHCSQIRSRLSRRPIYDWSKKWTVHLIAKIPKKGQAYVAGNLNHLLNDSGFPGKCSC